jgi:hypothetical protein
MSAMLRRIASVAGIIAFLALACHSLPAAQPATQPAAADSDDADLAGQFNQETAGLGGQRSFKDGVLTIVLPRTDLWVQNDMGEIPTGAGIASRFYFYRCPCGKDRVVGEFALADYELNDVIDVLRDGQMDIVSVSSMFTGEKPRMMSLRFQSEGQAEGMAGILHGALKVIGDHRTENSSPDTQANP